MDDTNLEVFMLPIKVGDATLLRYTDSDCQHTVLIDTGKDKDEAITYLQSIGISRLDLIILSHPDMDHLGGLLSIMESKEILVDRLWCFDLNFLREFIQTGKIPPPRPSTYEIDYARMMYATFDRFSDSLKAAQHRGGVEVLQVSEGYQLCLGGMLIEVLYPPNEFYDALRTPWALKSLLGNRKWPDDWSNPSEEQRENGEEPRARALSREERREYLSNLLENIDAPPNPSDPLLNPTEPDPWPESVYGKGYNRLKNGQEK